MQTTSRQRPRWAEIGRGIHRDFSLRDDRPIRDVWIETVLFDSRSLVVIDLIARDVCTISGGWEQSEQPGTGFSKSRSPRVASETRLRLALADMRAALRFLAASTRPREQRRGYAITKKKIRLLWKIREEIKRCARETSRAYLDPLTPNLSLRLSRELKLSANETELRDFHLDRSFARDFARRLSPIISSRSSRRDLQRELQSEMTLSFVGENLEELASSSRRNICTAAWNTRTIPYLGINDRDPVRVILHARDARFRGDDVSRGDSRSHRVRRAV